MMTRGRYIVIEGTDGAGKGEQVKRVLERLDDCYIPARSIYEPGGTLMGDEIRRILKDKDLPRQPITNVFLFNAARAEALTHIKTLVEAGVWVVCDRNRISTFVYQGHAEGVELGALYELDELVHRLVGIAPDLELVLRVPLELAAERIQRRGEERDYFEQLGIEQKLLAGYDLEANARQLPLIDASGSIDEVFAQVWSFIEPLIKEAE